MAIEYLRSPINALFFFLSFTFSTANDFEPYKLNGGLVSAVAGEDFVVVASDTRLSDGYEILTRNHLQSRLWAASGGEHWLKASFLSNDGSVVVPTETSSHETPSILSYTKRPPTFVASAGCASDCEALKRQIRAEIDSHLHWNYGKRTLSPSGVANILGQTLYSRRGFPFYSFCIVAGLDDVGGVVHVYDAIGSHERVAVASAGTGKEMLQPILDRMFTSTNVLGSDTGCALVGNDDDLGENGESGLPELVRDGRAVHATEQRVGLKLQPPVETCVKCSAEETVALLVKAYRSVAEREIAVGDNVVLCLVRKRQDKGIDQNYGDEKNGKYMVEVLHYPLKKH